MQLSKFQGSLYYVSCGLLISHIFINWKFLWLLRSFEQTILYYLLVFNSWVIFCKEWILLTLIEIVFFLLHLKWPFFSSQSGPLLLDFLLSQKVAFYSCYRISTTLFVRWHIAEILNVSCSFEQLIIILGHMLQLVT